MWWVVDRIEGRIAVLVSDSGVELDTVAPRGIREGWVYRATRLGFRRDRAEERRRARAAAQQLRQLQLSDRGGNISL